MENQTTSDIVSCKTMDGDIFQVPLEVIKQSHTFTHMYDLGLDDNDSFIFPVAIKTEVFTKVVDWCNNHIGVIEPVVEVEPLTKENILFELTEYEKKFFEVSLEELVELTTAANYLDLRSLYLFGCQSLSFYLKNKTSEELRAMLNLPDDLTEEEKQEIKQKNIWCMH